MEHAMEVLGRVVDKRLREIVKLDKEMCNGATTRVRTERGVSAEFPVTVALHTGSALSPFLFVVVLKCQERLIMRATACI